MTKRSKETQELFSNFNEMFRKCVKLKKDLLEIYKINVVTDDNSYFQIAWPRSDENKLYVKPVATNFGAAFKTLDGKKPSEEGLKLAKQYITQIKFTKKYGRLLITYAEAMDHINKDPNTVDIDNLNQIVKAMKVLYILTNGDKKKNKRKKEY